MKERNHYDLKEIENYCRTKTFPKRLAGKGEKQFLDEPQSTFLLNMDNYITKRGDLSLQIRIIHQVDIIHDTHEGSVDTSHSKARSALLGRTPRYEKTAAHFFWYEIYNDVVDYMQVVARGRVW